MKSLMSRLYLVPGQLRFSTAFDTHVLVISSGSDKALVWWFDRTGPEEIADEWLHKNTVIVARGGVSRP